MTRRRHEIIVVGGGVVGAAAALAFVRQGFDVALIERGATPPAFARESYDPRVYAISPGSVKFLEGLGAWNRIQAQRVSPYGRMQVWEQSPAQALTFDAAELGVPELGFIIEDNLLRASLWSALAGAATVLTGAQVAAFAVTDGRPNLSLANGDTLEAALIVAAEGVDSPLREWAGIHPVGWTYPQRSLVCHVSTGKPHHATAYQRFMPNGPLALLPLADGRSSIVWSTDAQEAEALLRLDDAGFRERLAGALDRHLGEVTDCSKRLAFPLRLMHAETYVQPGLALVGDSAHVIHPLAGQGLNLGLADAAVLAQVVAEARAQRKSPGNLRVLQRYERRRKADNLEAMALTDGLYRLFKARVPGLDAVREFGMSLVNRAGPLKRRLAQRAMGIS